MNIKLYELFKLFITKMRYLSYYKDNIIVFSIAICIFSYLIVEKIIIKKIIKKLNIRQHEKSYFKSDQILFVNIFHIDSLNSSI